MVKLRKFIGIIPLIILILFLTNPSALFSAAAEGVSLCFKIIIPSLFPFTAIILFLFNCSIFETLSKKITPVSRWLIGLHGEAFFVLIMSFVGGYPIGAKLVNQLRKSESVTGTTAKRMLYYTVNPGPAFVIIGIGRAMYNRTDIGVIIYFSNIVASIIICFICSFKERKNYNFKTAPKHHSENVSDIFVNSVADASAAVISICGYVILFSAIIGVIKTIAIGINIKPIIALLEISNGTIIYNNNIYILSFLTAFSGFCVHAQIMSVCKDINVNYITFFLARILNGVLSALSTYVLVKIFKPSIQTISLVSEYRFELSAGTIILSASLIFMSLTLLVSTKQKYVEKRR